VNRKSIAWIAATLLLVAAIPLNVALAQSENETGYRLSLADCLRIALDNNLDLVSASYGPELAQLDVEDRLSPFDSVFEADYSHFESESAPSQASQASAFEQDDVNTSLTKALQFGASYNLGFGVQEQFFDSANSVSDSTFRSDFNVGFSMPLLKGFGTEPTTELLILARNDLEISRTDLEGQAETTIESVEAAYWDVVAAREAVRIAQLSLERAEDLLELNRKKVEVGTLAPIEITQAEAGVASQEEGVIVAETTLADAEDELRRLMAIPHSDPIWETPLDTVDRPVFQAYDVDVDAAIAVALESRSEMVSARQAMSNDELSERVAQRRLRHQLDLNLAYTFQGSDLDEIGENPAPPPAFVITDAASGSDAVSNVFNGDEFNWSAQLTYRIPLGNRDAKTQYARAGVARRQAQTALANQEQTVRVEVRRAARAVESGTKRVQAARKNVELQHKKLDAEQKKFENGMSTSFEVLTFQNDLADAELSEVRARLDHIKALAALERSKGTLLEARGLSLADARTGDDAE